MVKNEAQWTDVIEPKRAWLDINLAELWRYRDLVALFVKRDFTTIYKQTILGPLWLFIQPVFTTAMYVFVFSKVAKLSTDGQPAILFYLAGITLWTYFADCLLKTSNTFTANAGIFGKVYFPRIATPVSIVISNLLKFGVQFSLFISFLIYYLVTQPGVVQLHYTALLFPFLVLLMALMGLGFGLIFSSLTTKYKDLSHLLQFGIQLLMYSTTVIYPLSALGGKLKLLVLANPVTPVIEAFRYSFLGSGSFSWVYLGYTGVFTAVVLAIGMLVFNQVEKSFMDTV